MPASTSTLGIDFGTTNTVVSMAGDDGEAVLADFTFDGAASTTFRSCMSFRSDSDQPNGRLVEAGPWAIDAYPRRTRARRGSSSRSRASPPAPPFPRP